MSARLARCLRLVGVALLGVPAAALAQPAEPAGAVPELRAFLTPRVTEADELAPPAETFSDRAASVFLVIDAGDFGSPVLEARVDVVAEEAEGVPPGTEVALRRGRALRLRANERAVHEIAPEDGWFRIGRYTARVSAGNLDPLVLGFEITSSFPDAELLVEGAPRPQGFNVAARAFGGVVLLPEWDRDTPPRSVSGGTSNRWAPFRLIDGTPYHAATSGFGGELECSSCGWAAPKDSLPVDVVLTLAGDAAPRIEAVVIDPRTFGTRGRDVDLNVPRYIEIGTSVAAEPETFESVATVRVRPDVVEQLVRFPPHPARYVRLRLLDTYADDGGSVRLGEVRVIEAAPPSESVVPRDARNLASPDLGGVLVSFAPSFSFWSGATPLVDGVVSPLEGWQSDWSSSRRASFPYHFVFAFRDDREAFVEHIVIDPLSGSSTDTPAARMASWPSEIAVAVSTELDPTTGFREIGTYAVEASPGEQTFPVRARARFLRLSILANHGGRLATQLGEVKIIEGDAPGHDSILVAYPPPGTAAEPGAGSSAVEPQAGFGEREPNDAPEQAQSLPVDALLTGRIEPPGDVDNYTVRLDASAASAVNVYLHGTPHIKTTLTAYAPDGSVVHRFDPATAGGREEIVSWPAERDAYRLELAQAPSSAVLAWDTSGSMEGHTGNLETAVAKFLELIEPEHRVNMIRFSGTDVEVLLPELTNDRAALAAALEGKFFAEGGTPLYDALDTAMDVLQETAGNRAIVLLSDGGDSSSSVSNAELWRRLAEKPARIYVVGLGEGLQVYEPRLASTGERVLRHIAAATDGEAVFTADSAELERLYARIAADLNAPARYALSASAVLPAPAASESIREALAREGRAEVYGIYFDFASDKIRPESDAVLDEIAAALAENPAWNVTIEGHTDNIGGDAYNMELSARRARAVRQALIERYGVDPGRLQAVGHGSTRPKEPNDTAAGRAQNRRVELLLER